jgi:hypothetical protein
MNVYVACVAVLSLVVAGCNAGETDSDQGSGLAFRVSGEATAADAGLPAYPGAKPYKDEDDSDDAANLGISTPAFGLKVVAMNLETRDAPERVATFYQKALSRYGRVLECRDDGADDTGTRVVAADGDELVCEEDEPGTHTVVYKVGTEKNQRLVAIKPHGTGTRFSLVHFDVRGETKD